MIQKIDISYDVVDRGGEKMVLVTEEALAEGQEPGQGERYRVLTDYVPDLPGFYLPTKHVALGQSVDGTARILRKDQVVANGSLWDVGGRSPLTYFRFSRIEGFNGPLPFEDLSGNFRTLNPAQSQAGDRIEYTIFSDQPFGETLPTPFYLYELVHHYNTQVAAYLRYAGSGDQQRTPLDLRASFNTTPIRLTPATPSAVLFHQLLKRAYRAYFDHLPYGPDPTRSYADAKGIDVTTVWDDFVPPPVLHMQDPFAGL